jgi:hypothetical protein
VSSYINRISPGAVYRPPRRPRLNSTVTATPGAVKIVSDRVRSMVGKYLALPIMQNHRSEHGNGNADRTFPLVGDLERWNVNHEIVLCRTNR